jgi:hypothetical protein
VDSNIATCLSVIEPAVWVLFDENNIFHVSPV